MLSVEGLNIRYGEIVAVRRVDLAVGDGEIVALVGANGAGKSSTLNGIAGLSRASAGKVMFDNVDITNVPPELIARRGISLVPEGRRIFSSLSVADNLRLGGSAHLRASEVKVREEEMLDLFPVLRRYHRNKGGNLSGGEQQMLAISRALMARPRLILLDEPSLGLAPLLVQEIFRIIARINQEEKTTMLLVEQNANVALSIAHFGYIMESGRIVLDGETDKLKTNEDVREFYLGGGEGKKSYKAVKS